MISQGRPSETIREILELTTEAQIASYYLGINTIPVVINSPLRRDSKPSFGIFSPDGVRIKYIDFSNKDSGDIFTLLKKMWNMSLSSVCRRIYEDFRKFDNDINVQKTNPSVYSIANVKSNNDLKCKIREWRDYDVEYWSSYGISIDWLKYAEVYPVSHKIIIKDGIKYVYGADKYAYAFVERKDNRVTLKIYQPYNKNGYKWANKHDRSVIGLWTKVPQYGDKICICSSVKDALCLMCNTKIPSICLQGEGYGMSDTAINELKRRYKHIYILLDRDDVGLKDAEILAEKTGFTNIVLPDYGEKDVSDLFKKLQDKELFKSIILKLFSNGSKTNYSRTD